MISLSDAAESIIKRSPYLSETFAKGLINTSALARYLKPQLEKAVMKPVSDAAILMALRRLTKKLKLQTASPNIFTSIPDILVRSNLVEINIMNSESLVHKHAEIVRLCSRQAKYFFTTTQGLFETTIIVSNELLSQINSILQGEKKEQTFIDLSAITIRLPKESLYTPGTYFLFLKSLAWEGVNFLEVVSAYLELTIILEEKEVNRAFGILKSLFEN